MGKLLFGGTLPEAFLGGMAVLLAPSSVSVISPPYLARGVRRRSGISIATLVLALGVATTIVPVGLNATAIAALLSGRHALGFSIAATAMLIGGVALLAGRKLRLTMIGRAPTGRGFGFGSVDGLGVFSGVASYCCAPILVSGNHVMFSPGVIADNRLIAHSRLSKSALVHDLVYLADTN
jgi:cytochrome c-type biogenesis protein